MRYLLALFLFTLWINNICVREVSAQESGIESATTVSSNPAPIEVDVFEPIEFKIPIDMPAGWVLVDNEEKKIKKDKIVLFDDEFNLPEKIKIKQLVDGTTFAWAPPGQYVISGKQIYVNFTKEDIFKRIFDIRIIVKGTTPTPDPEPDPDPTPNPIPDQNNPFAGVNGLKVLIVEEQDERFLPAKEPQYRVISSRVVREYLDKNTVKDSGGNAEWRILDQDTVIRDKTSQWFKAIAVPRVSVPWIIISDGKKWKSVAVPANEADMLALLKQFTPIVSRSTSVPHYYQQYYTGRTIRSRFGH